MKWRVKEVAEMRGYTNARALGKAAEVPPMSIYQIWNGTASRVDLETLNKLCNLLRVPLALLLEHTPDQVEPLPGSGSAEDQKPARRSAAKSRGKQSRRATPAVAGAL